MKTETTKTEVNLITIKQRMAMLPNPPANPVKGRGAVRHCLTNEAEIVDFLLYSRNPHVACVSVREPINRFGKLGTPKYVFCSPEMFALFS